MPLGGTGRPTYRVCCHPWTNAYEHTKKNELNETAHERNY